MRRNPTFKHERELMKQGYRAIVGVDEAGCGALAGPIVAGAVILPLDSRIGRLHDSKLLSAKRREEIYEEILKRAHAWSTAIATVEEIMRLNVRQATLLAMRRAVEQIDNADYILVDAWAIPGIETPQRGIVSGDRKIKSIAAGSVLAKVTRDHMMREYHEKYPVYGFDRHKGYGTRLHRSRIDLYGPCEIHRLTYKTFQT